MTLNKVADGIKGCFRGMKKTKYDFIYTYLENENDYSKARRLNIVFSDTLEYTFYAKFELWLPSQNKWVTKYIIQYNSGIKYLNTLSKELAINLLFDSKFKLKVIGVIK